MSIDTLDSLRAERDDYRHRLLKVASTLEPHYLGATPPGTVPTWQWIILQIKRHEDSLVEDWREDWVESKPVIEGLRASLGDVLVLTKALMEAWGDHFAPGTDQLFTRYEAAALAALERANALIGKPAPMDPTP